MIFCKYNAPFLPCVEDLEKPSSDQEMLTVWTIWGFQTPNYSFRTVSLKWLSEHGHNKYCSQKTTYTEFQDFTEKDDLAKIALIYFII